MSDAQYELEHIVREVLRRLRELERTGNNPAETAGTTDPATLSLAESVVTLDGLKGKLSGVKTLVMPRGAVITPSARDELKKQRIRLEFAAGTKTRTQTSAQLVVSVVTPYNWGPLDRKLSAAGVSLEVIDAADWKEAVTKMTQEIRSRQAKGAILTDRPAAAACLANRDGAIRAAVAVDGRSTRDAIESLGANLLVIDPAMHSLHTLERLLREYANSEARGTAL